MRILFILFAFLLLWDDVDSFAPPRPVVSRSPGLSLQQQHDSNENTRPLKKLGWRHRLVSIALGTMLWWKGPTDEANLAHAKAMVNRHSVRPIYKAKLKQTSSHHGASWKTNSKKTIKIGTGVVVLTAVTRAMLVKSHDDGDSDDSSQLAQQSPDSYYGDGEIPPPPPGILAAKEVDFEVPWAWKEAIARNSGASMAPSDSLFEDDLPEIGSDEPNLSDIGAPTAPPTLNAIFEAGLPDIGSDKPNLSQIISSDTSDKDAPLSWREEVDFMSEGFNFNSEPPASNDVDAPLLWREKLAEKESSSSNPLPWERGDPQDPNESNPYEGGSSWA